MGRHLRTYQHVAQKEHWCDRCCRNIHPGEMYEGDVQTNNHGGIIVFKVHIEPACDYPEDPVDEDQRVKRKDIERIVSKNASLAA